MSDQPCSCHECITAGCTEPPHTLPNGQVLHGRQLAKFYADRDERRAWFADLKAKLAAKGIKAQRGDEPR
jgi:hypothetical protein